VGDVLFGAADVAQANLRMRATVRPQSGATPIPAAQAPADSLPVEFTLVRAARDLDNGDAYMFVSAATNATIQDLENAAAQYPAEIADKFIQIPPEFSPRVAELAQRLTADAVTPYEKAKAIETYLRTIPYDDAISAPPAGVDPLEYFLFDIQRGYCDYYATAMAMMLRVVGVPARTASGYAEGLFDEESQSYFITQRDAHTWVEVFFPEYGWIEFEPTAGESPLDRQQQDEDEMAVTSQREEEQPPSPLAPTPPAQQNPEDLPPQFTGEELLQQPGGGAGGSSLPWWVWALALLLLLPAGGYMIWRARSSGPSAFSADLPLLLYERLQQWAQRLGIGPAAHQTPYEHSQQLVAALPESQPYVTPLTEEYVRYRFAPQSGAEALPAGTLPAGAAHADGDLLQKWQAVEPIFWKAWLRKLRGRLLRPQQDVYHLVDDQPPTERD
jgi:transglutaminase-like putative cysteine protease